MRHIQETRIFNPDLEHRLTEGNGSQSATKGLDNSMVDNAASQEAPPQQEIQHDPNLAADTLNSIPVYKENDVSKQEHIASKIKEHANNGKYLIFDLTIIRKPCIVSVVLFYI